MAVVYKIFVDKLGGRSSEDYIGQSGDLFYNPASGALRVSDGETPGGSALHVHVEEVVHDHDILPSEDNMFNLGSDILRWKNIFLGPGTIYITDTNPLVTTQAELTVTDGVLQINGTNQLQVGDLKFVDNTIESTQTTTNIEIGLLTSTANITLNRDVVLGNGKTFTGDIIGNADTVTNGVYTDDTGSVTNTMLAGSIANNKLANSSLTIGSTSLSLGSASTALAGMTNITFAAGTDAVAPIKLTAGSLLASPAGGALEYSSNMFYATPNPTTRGILESKQIYYNTAQSVLLNNTSQQSIFGLTNGVAVSYATRYKFKIVATIRATADNVNLFFALGGTATYYRSNYHATVGKGSYGPGMMPTTVIEVYALTDGQTRNTINIAQGGVGGTYFQVTIEGILDTQYSGYVKPIVALSPAPGASSFVDSKSYMEIYPIGPAAAGNADTVVGNWS